MREEEGGREEKLGEGELHGGWLEVGGFDWVFEEDGCWKVNWMMDRDADDEDLIDVEKVSESWECGENLYLISFLLTSYTRLLFARIGHWTPDVCYGSSPSIIIWLGT